MTGPADDPKRRAAVAAVTEVEDGMVLGLGTGSTAKFAVEALATRMTTERLRVVGIPTSEQTAALARRLNIPLTDFAEHRRIDLTIDGADQVELGSLNLIKGLGGALLREKIVAAASHRMLVIVDRTKVVDRLAGQTALPVEITSFGWQSIVGRLADLEGAPVLRTATGGEPFVTDGGNLIADCSFGAALDDPATLQRRLREIVGVVETGLFIGLASRVIVGTADGIEILDRRE